MTEDQHDDEYELEPVDPDVIKHQQERTKRKTREAEDTVDINEAFDQAELSDPVDLDTLKQFRFTTRHLLMATAVFAIVMTFHVRLGGCMGLFVSGAIALGIGWWIVMREERRRLEELEAQQKAYKQRLAARRAVEDGKPVPMADAGEFDQAGDLEEEVAPRPPIKFSFSTKELLITFTVAVLILGLASLLGLQTAALLLGFVALVGLLIQAFGIELPPILVLGWWLLLVLYILLSLWSTFSSSGGA